MPASTSNFSRRATLRFATSRFATSRRGFTLTEILVALAIVGVLAAILFPVLGRAREGGRQNHCAGNLQNIYLATRQYREDFQAYPPNLEVLLPAGSVVVATTGGHNPLANGREEGEISGGLVDPFSQATSGGDEGNFKANLIDTKSYRIPSLSYLHTLDEVVCPSDDVALNGFSSSYGAKIGSVWNFHGYDRLGFQLQRVPGANLLLDPKRPYDARLNPVKFSLANRFAAPATIITHCIFHRQADSDLKSPYELATDAAQNRGMGAKDIVLRLDGSAKTRDVSAFQGTNSDGSDSAWQVQTY